MNLLGRVLRPCLDSETFPLTRAGFHFAPLTPRWEEAAGSTSLKLSEIRKIGPADDGEACLAGVREHAAGTLAVLLTRDSVAG